MQPRRAVFLLLPKWGSSWMSLVGSISIMRWRGDLGWWEQPTAFWGAAWCQRCLALTLWHFKNIVFLFATEIICDVKHLFRKRLHSTDMLGRSHSPLLYKSAYGKLRMWWFKWLLPRMDGIVVALGLGRELTWLVDGSWLNPQHCVKPSMPALACNPRT